MIKIYCLILSFSIFCNIYHCPENNLIIYISPNLKKNFNQDFKNILFQFQLYLKYAYDKNLTVNVYLPTTVFECKSPWEKDSFLSELDRTILATASSFYRVNPGFNISIILCSNMIDLHDIKFNCHFDNLYDNLNRDTINLDEREKLFKKNCLINYENLNNNKKNYEYREFNLNNVDKQIILNINLPDLKTGQKRVLITGGSGFIGSYLVEKFLNDGHQVIILDNNFCSSSDNISHLLKNENLCFINCDVTINYTINETITDVLHFASIPSPEFYYNYPLETLKTGLIGTEYAYNLAKKHHAKFLFASTSEFYGDPEINPQPESYHGNVSCVGKRSQYDQSKRFAEAYLNYFAKQDKIDVRIVRIFNTYGPRMLLNDGRIVTNFLKSYFSGNPFSIHGSGNQTRSFCYVTDLVDGILKLHNHDFDDNATIREKTFNIGNQNELSINDLVKIMNDIIFKNTNYKCLIEIIDPIDLDDPKQRRPDLNRANKILSYKPKLSFWEGFEKMLESYLEK
jgi:nucleoside-diphosphate-sugar epimerase